MAHRNLLKDFKKPNRISFEHDVLNPNYAKFTVSPLEKGFGITLANALRRTLLSSIQGYAITAIRVEYINSDGKNALLSNEFENIYGLYEDTIYFIQNLKKVYLKLLDDAERRTIFIEKKGEGELKASDLEVDTNIKVFNPDHKLATFNEDASVFIELQIELNRGYKPSDRVDDECIDVVGTIPIDAVFSPIEKVTYSVENTRIGQRTDYDKIYIELWTDGTISPDDAIADASKILKEHFTCFINFDETDEHFEEEKTNPEEEKLNHILNTPIEDLELSVRSSNSLRVAGILTIRDLVLKSEDEIQKIKNLGKKSTVEITTKLATYKLTLGMKHLAYLTKKLSANTQAM